MAPDDTPGHDDGDPHATELAPDTGEALPIVAPALKCGHCGAMLPPDATPCPGLGDLPALGQYALEEIEWRNADGQAVQSKAPRVCVERFRGADGKVRWPRAA